MSTKQSSIISNPTSTPVVLNAGAVDGGKVRHAIGTIELATTDIDLNDTIEICDLPTNAVVKRIWIANDDLDSAGPTITFDLGLYSITAAGALSTVKDVDAYANASTQLGSAAGLTDLSNHTRNIDKIGQRVWQDAGDASDPGGSYRLVATIDAAATTPAAGTLSFQVEYTVEA